MASFSIAELNVVKPQYFCALYALVLKSFDYTYQQIKHNIVKSSAPDISRKIVLDGDYLKQPPR